MTYRRMGFDFLVIFIFFCIHNASAYGGRHNLKTILDYNSKRPLIAVLLKHKANPIKVPDTESDDLTPVVDSPEPPHDQKLYNFYAMLRTVQENEDVDPQAAEVFEKTQNVLREALRKRCEILDKCVQKCPRKKKYTCTISCKETYDDYDMCEKPKKKQCKKPKCGKTMPPSWLLRNYNF